MKKNFMIVIVFMVVSFCFAVEPSNLEVICTSCSAVKFSDNIPGMQIIWTDNGGEGFYIYRRTDTTPPSLSDRIDTLAASGSNQVVYQDTTIAAGTKYYYWVSSYVIGAGESNKTGPESDWADYISQVSGLTASQTGNDAITWSWSPASGALKYLIVIWNADYSVHNYQIVDVGTSYTLSGLSAPITLGATVTANFSSDGELNNCQSDFVWIVVTGVGVKYNNTFEFDLYLYPNPFNPTTTINFSLPYDEQVKLSVYDLRGREVMVLVDDFRTAGEYSILWNAVYEPSGVYFARLQTDNQTKVIKMQLVK
ncbi:MAG TPA: T9SS type A sorting domain-containing protein [bacterium]|nr:T9SS type A sorting domain-containing protein [bacterium]HPL95694.1 T9SS type A sorting domain-containing protein [bacterium]